MRIHSLGTAKEGHRRVRFLENLEPTLGEEERGEEESVMVRMIEREVPIVDLNKRYLNASFVGELAQCTVDDGSCAAIPKEIEFSPYIDWREQNQYKVRHRSFLPPLCHCCAPEAEPLGMQYVLDVDGNSWSGRFRRLLASHSLVFKSSIWPEWYVTSRNPGTDSSFPDPSLYRYRDHIQPWYHYIPARIDNSDVYDLMAFFTGDMDGKYSQDALAERISDNGHDFVKHHWRYEDLQACKQARLLFVGDAQNGSLTLRTTTSPDTWRMYLEWARVSSDDRASMDFVLEG